MIGALFVEGSRVGLIGTQLWLSYWYFYRSRRQTLAVKIRNARLVNCERSWSCVTDRGCVAGLTGGGGPCESWFRVLLFCCRGGSAACPLASGGTRRRCPRANQARG